MTKWEYRLYGMTSKTRVDNEAELNELGKQGWELVSVENPSDQTDHWCLFFKRPAGPPPFT